MSTRATIGLKQPNGKIDTIICWHDGYLDGAGRILKKHYDTPEKIEKLMQNGNLELIQPTIKRCEFQYQGDDATPEDCQAETLKDTDALLYQVRNFNQDYGYLFQDGQWFFYKRGETTELRPL
jgi:hypothetical protein